jgi:hypothetical protein
MTGVFSPHYLILITLFRQEQLAVHGKFLLAGISCNKRIEQSWPAIFFRAQNPAQPLRLFLAAAECAGNLNQNACIWQVYGKISNLANG